ncbi:hypothetical protein SAMN05421509_104290 [Chromohalobacter canadensis]|uniref:Uncharacterized protein n=1 Tax=Chromohalobacter canadensis TaxID=141389 RepID=A0A285VLL7_9GAMM|nr:hypothetical protein SAMN05421509_104290 [Chromohalobacter canadensis]
MILEKVSTGEDAFTPSPIAWNRRQVTQGTTPAKVAPLIAD